MKVMMANECVRISASRCLTITNTGPGKYPCPDSSSDYSDTPRSRFQRFSPPDVSPLDDSLQVAFTSGRSPPYVSPLYTFTSGRSPPEVSPLGAFTSMSFHLYGVSSPVGIFTSTYIHNTCIHSLHTYMHTYIHTYTHIHIQTVLHT